MSYLLHLNGGPRDDQYIKHWANFLEIAKPTPMYVIMSTGLSDPVGAADGLITGRYRVRLDGNGDMVPHNLEGFVECDWQGWR